MNEFEMAKRRCRYVAKVFYQGQNPITFIRNKNLLPNRPAYYFLQIAFSYLVLRIILCQIALYYKRFSGGYG